MSLFHVTVSGNGLISYYINIVLEGVGIMNPGTKAAINGGLQVGLYLIRRYTSIKNCLQHVGVESMCCDERRASGRQIWPQDALYLLKHRDANQ